MPSRMAKLVVSGVLLSLAACVSLKRTPEARFFVLRSLVEPTSAAETTPGTIVGLTTVRVPGYLQRPQLVTGSGPHELQIDEFTRWAEPLDEGVSRVLAENLSALLPEHRVVAYPWSASLELKLRCRIAVELESFSAGRDGKVRVEGRWSLLEPSSGRALSSAPALLEAGPVAVEADGAEPQAAVAALSGLLAELSASIAEAVKALPVEPESE